MERHKYKLCGQTLLLPDTFKSHPYLFGWATAMPIKGKRKHSLLRGRARAALSLPPTTVQQRGLSLCLSFVRGGCETDFSNWWWCVCSVLELGLCRPVVFHSPVYCEFKHWRMERLFMWLQLIRLWGLIFESEQQKFWDCHKLWTCFVTAQETAMTHALLQQETGFEISSNGPASLNLHYPVS